MSTEVKYTDGSGRPIGSEELQFSTEYSKLTFFADQLKLIESVNMLGNSTYTIVQYFLAESEDKEIIKNQYTNVDADISCILYFNVKSANGFKMWSWERYSEFGDLLSKGKKVFDVKYRLIFTCAFELSSNVLLSGGMKNYYSGETGDENLDVFLQFEYDSEGQIEWIHDPNKIIGYDEPISLNAFLNDNDLSVNVFPWEKHLYYHSITPYLPHGIL